MSLKKIFLTCLTLIGLSGCGKANEGIEVMINTPIPVKSQQPINLSDSMFNLMNVTPGVDCYQNNVFLLLHDAQTDRIVATKPVKLRTNLINTITYSNLGSDVDSAITHLQSSSYIEEPLSMLIPKDHPYEVGIAGNFYQPKDVNGDGICDEVDMLTGPANIVGADQGLSISRDSPAKVVLQNGNILVIAGINSGSELNSAEFFNPNSRTWSSTANNLSAARSQPAAVVLDNGKVLAMGGKVSSFGVSDTDLYDPSTNTWSVAPTPTPSALRYGHTATLLPNGKVLVAGGTYSGPPLNTGSLYDPATNTWSAVPGTHTARVNHTATLMTSGPLAGKVVLIGGYNGAIIDTYNYLTNTWGTITPTGTFTFREKHTANLLPNGNILVVGGVTYTPSIISNVDIFDGIGWTNKAAVTGVRYGHTTNILPDGRAVVIGGNDGSYPIANINVSNAVFTSWTILPMPLNTARNNHNATLLPDFKIMVTGGSAYGSALSNTETIMLRQPALYSTGMFGHAVVDNAALTSRSLSVKIGVLHTNPTSTYAADILANPGKYHDWAEFPDTSFTAAGTASGNTLLDTVGYIRDDTLGVNNLTTIHVLNTVSNAYYVPHIFPMVFEFIYRGSAAGDCSNALPNCAGRYRAVMNDSNFSGAGMVATLIAGTATTGSTPPATISTTNTVGYRFRIIGH